MIRNVDIYGRNVLNIRYRVFVDINTVDHLKNHLKHETDSLHAMLFSMAILYIKKTEVERKNPIYV